MDLCLIRLADRVLNGMFSDPHCRFTATIDGSGFNQIGGQGFNEMFSDPHCRFTATIDGSMFNQIGGQGF